jgi:hypothetical protein
LTNLLNLMNAAARCPRDARSVSHAPKSRYRSLAHVVAILFGVQAVVALELVSTAHAGPCTKEIEALQGRVDAILEATAGAGPTLPESRSAGLHHEPTPQSIARAEEQAGEGAVGEHALAGLARAREADRAGNAVLCDAALNNVRREIAP